MAQDRKRTISTGSAELDEREAKRQEERLEEGLEPERHPGPRQNDGISTSGRLYASAEEAEEENPSRGARRDDVDEEAQRGVAMEGAAEDPERGG